MTTITPPAAIFFDMDGTILDWESGLGTSWMRACEAHCGPARVDAHALHAAIAERRDWFWSDAARAYEGRFDLRLASRTIVGRALDDLDAADGALASRIGDSYRDLRDAALAPYPGAIETLAAFHGRGVPMALITNGGAASQRRSVERFGLERYFRCIIIEGEFGAGKPDERVFRHALNALACAPEETWMVGDNLHADIATPVRLGMHAIWVDASRAGLPADAPCAPHQTVAAIRELVEGL